MSGMTASSLRQHSPAQPARSRRPAMVVKISGACFRLPSRGEGLPSDERRMTTTTATDSTSITKLAHWSLADEPAYRSEPVLRQARLLVLDTIGCVLDGAAS